MNLPRTLQSLFGLLNNHDSAKSICERVRPTLETLEDRVQPSASPVGLGAAGDYGVLAVNAGSLSLRAARVDGDVGVGPRVNVDGNWARIDGVFHQDPTARVRLRNVVASGGFVTRNMAQAVADANAASAANAALAATQTFGNVTNSLTINGNGGNNVISLRSLDYRRDTLTLRGGANDVFVFNVSGNFSFARSRIVLDGGVTADHVLFNFPTRGREVVLRGAGSAINGTFLAPYRRIDFARSGNFNGALIGQNVDVGAWARLREVAFNPNRDETPVLGSLSGYVYYDQDENGEYGPEDDLGIGGVEITLTGTDDLGNAVSLTTYTDEDGYYEFANLRPGNYEISQVQPEGYINGLENWDNLIDGLVLAAGQNGVNNNFGELLYVPS